MCHPPALLLFSPSIAASRGGATARHPGPPHGAVVPSARMTSTSPYDASLVALYQQQGLLDGSGSPTYLPEDCPMSSPCWAHLTAEHRPPRDAPASRLSPPWIGPRYAEGRTLVLMENLRHYGGFDLGPDAKRGMRYLGQIARAQLLEGRRRFFRGNTSWGAPYRGTDVWPQALAYAAGWLDAAGFPAQWSSPGRATDASLAQALDLVAIAQHVKCSPMTPKSDQDHEMWEQCGAHVLAHEIALLQPARIIVLGTSDNARALRQHVLPDRLGEPRRCAVPIGKGLMHLVLEERTAAYGTVRVLVVPHPARPGGTSRKLVASARDLVLEPAAQRPPGAIDPGGDPGTS